MQKRSEITQLLKVPIYKVPIYESTTFCGRVIEITTEHQQNRNQISPKDLLRIRL